MNLSDLIQSPELAEIVFNTAFHSFVFSIIVAGAIACSKRISPYISSGVLFTVLLLLIFLPFIEISTKKIDTAWWQLSMIEGPAPTSLPTSPPLAIPITANLDLPLQTSPTLWQQITKDSTTITNSVGMIWGLGILGMLARLLFSFSRLEKLRRCLVPIVDERVLAIWESLKGSQKNRPSISISQINANCSPFAFGFWSPHIVLPQDMLTKASSQELKDALLHEYNHIANRDLWLAVLQRITLTLYWWNPIVNWLEQQFSLSREKLCDIAVIALTGKPKAYASTLISLADRLNGFTPLPNPTARMATSFSLLEERIKNIATNRINMNTPRIKRLTWTACFAAVLIGLMTIGIKATWASPQQALATLKSNGNETVQLSIADNTVEVTVRTPDGRTQSVRLPVGDKAKAAELMQLIGNINSTPRDEVPPSDTYRADSNSSLTRYQYAASSNANGTASDDLYSNTDSQASETVNPSRPSIFSSRSTLSSPRIRSANNAQGQATMTFSNSTGATTTLTSPSAPALAPKLARSSASNWIRESSARRKPSSRTSPWPAAAPSSTSSNPPSILDPVIPIAPTSPLPMIAPAPIVSDSVQPAVPAKPQKPRRYRQGRSNPLPIATPASGLAPALSTNFGNDVPLSKRERDLIEQSRVLSEAIEVLRKRVDRFGVPPLNEEPAGANPPSTASSSDKPIVR